MSAGLAGAEVRAKLVDYLARLNDVIELCAEQTIVTQAWRYKRKLAAVLTFPDLGLEVDQGLFFENGWGPAMDDILRRAAFSREVELARWAA